MVKHLQTGFSVLLVSIVHEAFATKRTKMYFLSLVFVNFLVMFLFLVIILLQLWKVINVVCINITKVVFLSIKKLKFKTRFLFFLDIFSVVELLLLNFNHLWIHFIAI